MPNTRLGSSPRVRGAALVHAERVQVRGIIPARAGSRWISPADAVDMGDHPRACGEQWTGFAADVLWRDHPRACGEQARPATSYGVSPGSSPRVRGAGSGFRALVQ